MYKKLITDHMQKIKKARMGGERLRFGAKYSIIPVIEKIEEIIQ